MTDTVGVASAAATGERMVERTIRLLGRLVARFGLPVDSAIPVALSRKKGALGVKTPRAPYSALVMYGITPLVPRVRPIPCPRAGILALGSPYQLRLPILANSGTSSLRPRSQRRHRDGI